MAKAKVSRRDQIVEMIEKGTMTKIEIAEELGIKVSGVSSQLTYLRWMGKFIIFDKETKIMAFTDEDGFAEWEAAKAAGRTTKSKSNRTPQEQFEAYTKTLATQAKSLAKWENKLSLMTEDDYEVEDETLIPEAEANVTLLGIKIQRNEDKLAAINMDDVSDATEEVEEVNDEDEELL